MLLECINTSVWNLFIIPEEDWSQSKPIEEYEVNKLKNEDCYSCFYAFVQLPGHSSKTISSVVHETLVDLHAIFMLVEVCYPFLILLSKDRLYIHIFFIGSYTNRFS